MRYLIIGLGIYGKNLAIDLTKMGHEVIGADTNPSIVESIKDYISTAYLIDSTDEISIAALPIRNVDIVIVAIGENFGASIRTVALLKKMGVRHIYARAIDQLHESILESFDIDRILTPEQRAAFDLVNDMGVDSNTESLPIDSDHYVLKFKVPSFLIGMKYANLNFYRDYGLDLIAVSRQINSKNIMGISRSENKVLSHEDMAVADVEASDIIVCMGSKNAYKNLFNHVNPS